MAGHGILRARNPAALHRLSPELPQRSRLRDGAADPDRPRDTPLRAARPRGRALDLRADLAARVDGRSAAPRKPADLVEPRALARDRRVPHARSEAHTSALQS